jgi:hypothetical protein
LFLCSILPVSMNTAFFDSHLPGLNPLSAFMASLHWSLGRFVALGIWPAA